MSNINIKYKDKNLEYEKGITLDKIKNDIKGDYKFDIIVGTVNNKLVPFNTVILKDSNIDFYDISSPLGNIVYQKGLYFLLVKAVKDVLGCDIKLINKINNEIYCNILTNELISEVTVQKVKLRMKKLIEEHHNISKILVSRRDAIEYYKKIKQFDKSDTLRFISNSNISLFKLDDTLDYFYSVLPSNTNILSNFNIKYVENNMIVLLYPSVYNLNFEFKYNKNEKVINEISKNNKVLENLGISISSDVNKLISKGDYGNLIRISESIQNNRLFDIAEKISKNNNIKLVLMTGPSSSGKTTTSKKLSLLLRSMGLDPIPISIDDFYITLKDRVKDEDGKPEMEKIEAIDTNLFNKKITELLEGKEVILPKYNFVLAKQEPGDKKVKMAKNSILIIEGIHAFNYKLTEMVPDKNKYKIFIYPLTPINIDNHNMFTSYDNRLLRRIIRDNKTRGYSASECLEMWKKVRKTEEELIFPYMKDADEIFNTYLLYELNILKTYTEPLLFSVDEEDDNYEEAIRLINLFRVILSMPTDDIPNDSLIREFIGGSCFNV